MKFEADPGQRNLEVLGDSKLLMNWYNNKCQISNLAFGPTMVTVFEAKSWFHSISFSDIYREFNQKEDSLSNEALSH